MKTGNSGAGRRRGTQPPVPVRPADSRNHQQSASAPSPGRDSVVIRAVRAADLAQVMAIDEQITGIAKPDYWRAELQRASGEHHFLIAATGVGAREVAGFILGEVRAWEFGSAPCGWVYGLSVRPDARLHGCGQALLDALVSRFRSAGVARIRTMVARDNRLHLLFFRAAGMTAGPYVELEKELD